MARGVFRRGSFAGLICLQFTCCAVSALADESVDFQRRIRPILVDHCFACHGPDEGAREAGLRLDLRERATAELESGERAIVPGAPEQSALWQRVSSSDPDLVMPPPDQKNPLTEEQRADLRGWIAQGADYAGHWAFTAPQRPSVPGHVDSGLLSPIDNFVVHRLQRFGQALSSPAPANVLCRRIYLDLIGLPPSPRDVARFESAARQDRSAAVNALVERLLSSEQFGEKWARHWLDLARYADSNGFEKDLPRAQWAWRDWVIRAINSDMPYDQFIVEQVAGDLLPDATQDQIVATGFLRNGMINEEGAIIPEEFRMEGMFDRLDAVGKSVLGLSIQCAQCHSHKFDPISQSEYYGMFAFLNNTYEAQSWVYTAPQLEKIAEITAGVSELEQRLKSQLPDWADRIAAWEKDQLERRQSQQWRVLEAVDLHSKSELNHPVSLHDRSILTLGHPTSGDDLLMIAEPELKGVTGIRFEVLTYGDLPFGGPGRNFKGTWALTELIVETKQPGGESWEPLSLTNVTADYAEPEHALEAEWQQKGVEKEERLVGPAAFLADGKDETAWRADRGPGQRNTDAVAVAQFAQPVTLPAGSQLKISVRTKHGGNVADSFDQGPKNVMIGRFRVSLTDVAEPCAGDTPYAAVLAMQTPPDQRTARQRAAIFAAWRSRVPELKTLNDEIDALWRQFPEAPTSILHLAERHGEHTRGTFLLDRGVWSRPLEGVAPQIPASLHALPPHAPPNRLTFARWLVDEQSPLTARVQVNRVWQALFGAGLVRTPEDFGTRAPQPEYQDLLDWLAVEFMDEGWSLKQLLRRIVSSAAYQQDSTATAELIELDPENRLLARGPRFRAEAEVVRDIALSVSGLLDTTVGGRSIFPPVPQSVIDFNFVKPEYWHPPEGALRYRRALYVFRKRSMPDPLLTSFDAPNADISCAKRARSNTPLAALVSLNEPIFVEAARALALRILREAEATDEQRVVYAFRLCTSRLPSAAEQAEVLRLLQSRRKQLAEGWISINEVATGDPAMQPELPPEATPQDAAAWTIVARVLLNLDETLSKN